MDCDVLCCAVSGRTELPDNLKALFRPVTMVVPDMEQICEIMLFSEGFDSAKASHRHSTQHTASYRSCNAALQLACSAFCQASCWCKLSRFASVFYVN